MAPPRQSVPLNNIRAPAVIDDQLTQAQVQAQAATAADMQQFTSLILSQLRIAQGARFWDQGGGPQVVPPGGEAGNPTIVGAGQLVTQELLSGPYDGVELAYTTAHPFRPSDFRLTYNGLPQAIGPAEDYIVVEGGGPGTGFNTVLLVLALAPRPSDRLRATYVRTA